MLVRSRTMDVKSSKRSAMPDTAMRCWMMIAVVIGWGEMRQRTPSNAAGQRAIAQNVEFPPGAPAE